jgi:hypothetical protein
VARQSRVALNLKGQSQGQQKTEAAEPAETGERAAVSKSSVLINLLQALLAIILGNVVYFALIPSLPPVARHRPFHVDVGMALDFWFCLVAYGLIRTARRWR